MTLTSGPTHVFTSTTSPTCYTVSASTVMVNGTITINSEYRCKYCSHTMRGSKNDLCNACYTLFKKRVISIDENYNYRKTEDIIAELKKRNYTLRCAIRPNEYEITSPGWPFVSGGGNAGCNTGSNTGSFHTITSNDSSTIHINTVYDIPIIGGLVDPPTKSYTKKNTK